MFARILVCRELSSHIRWNASGKKQEFILGSCDCGTVVCSGWGGHRMEFACIRIEVPGSRQWVLDLAPAMLFLTTLLCDYSAAWATIIHLSYGNNGSGMKLKDLARSADEPASITGGLLLLFRRVTSRGTSRSARKSYEYCVPPSVDDLVRGLTW